MKLLNNFKFFVVLLILTGCLRQSTIQDRAKNKAKSIGIDLTDSKESKACKYFGFIGNNGVLKAKENGKIELMVFNYTDGNFLKKCTYVYGKN
jgi:hypothetical protein